VHLSGSLAAEAGENAVAHIAFLRLLRFCRPASRATSWAAGRLVLQTLASIELLLSGRENEPNAAVLADDFFVYVCQLVWNLLGTGRGKPLRILRIKKRLAQARGSRMTFDRIRHLQ
jgi:hypothetical protein